MKLNTLIFVLLLNVSCYASAILETIFGPLEITENVLCELIESPAMQRLKHIHQYGILYNLGFINYNYTRFDHSLGVLYLVRHFGGSLKEQIAALLHDVSHTVFSHVSDHLFKHSKHNSYQDDIHTWFINQTTIPNILTHHGLTVQDIIHKNNGFTRLEQELPNLCADRLEYIMHGALLEEKLTKDDITFIVASLKFENENWYFENKQAALQLAHAATYLNEFVFCSLENFISYELCATLLLKALSKEVISYNDIHFGCDQEIWELLYSCKDQDMQKIIQSMLNQTTWYAKTYNTDTCNFHVQAKLRAIDPYIEINSILLKLTAIDPSYKIMFNCLKNKLAHGICIQQKDPHATKLKPRVLGS